MKIWEQSLVIPGRITEDIQSREDRGGMKEHFETWKVMLLKNKDRQKPRLEENSNFNKREGGQEKEQNIDHLAENAFGEFNAAIGAIVWCGELTTGSQRSRRQQHSQELTVVTRLTTGEGTLLFHLNGLKELSTVLHILCSSNLLVNVAGTLSL